MPAAPQRRYAVQAHTGPGCDLRNPQQTLIENYLIGVCGGFFPRATMRAEFKPPFRMRANLLGLVVATLIPALSSCVYVPSEPAPPYPYTARVPLTAPPPAPHLLCDRGWHWVHGHQTRSGRWAEGHCARNVARPQRRRQRHSAPAAHAPAPNQSPAAHWTNPAPETPSASPPGAGR